MKVYNLPRAAGKTTRMLYISEFTGYPIVTHDRSAVVELKSKAESLGIKIPEPIMITRLLQSGETSLPPNVLVDEALLCFQHILGNKGIDIKAVTFSDDDNLHKVREYKGNSFEDKTLPTF